MNRDNLIFGFFTAVFLALYTAAAFFFFTDVTGSRLFYLLIAGLPPLAVLLLFPRAALIVVTLLVCSLRWMYDWLEILPREATWLSDFLIMILLLRTVLSMVGRRAPFIQIERLIVVLLGYAAFTSILNGVDKSMFVAGARFGFRYVMLFVAAYHLNVTPRFLKGYIYLMFGIALFQLPVLAAQARHAGWTNPDNLYGTFGRGGTTGMGLFLIVLVSYLVARMLEDARVHPTYLVLIALLSIPAIMGEVKFFFMFMPILVAVMVRKVLFRKPAVTVAMLLLAVSMVVGVDYVVSMTKSWQANRRPLVMLFNLPKYFRHEMEMADYGRYDRTFQYSQAIKIGLATPRAGLFGYGVGSNTESFAFGTSSPTLAMFSQWRMTSVGTMGVIWLFTEYGLVGLILISYLLWLMFRRAKILLASEDREERIYGRTLEAVVTIYAAWNFYGGGWQLDAICIGFWPLAAMLVRLSYQVEARRKVALEAAALPAEESRTAVPAV